MWVISPLVAKSTSTSLAGSRLPLPETVDWITPRATVTVRSWAVELAGEPTTSTAPTTAAAASVASATVVGAGRRRMSARALSRRALARRRLPVRRARRGSRRRTSAVPRAASRTAPSRGRVRARRWRDRSRGLPLPVAPPAAGDRHALLLQARDDLRIAKEAAAAGPRPRRPGAGACGGARVRSASAGGEADGDDKGAGEGADRPRDAHRQPINQPPLIGSEEARGVSRPPRTPSR